MCKRPYGLDTMHEGAMTVKNINLGNPRGLPHRPGHHGDVLCVHRVGSDDAESVRTIAPSTGLPLGRGMLARAVRSVTDLDDTDFRKTNPRFTGDNFRRNLPRLHCNGGGAPELPTSSTLV
jgi:hypothetical protein